MAYNLNNTNILVTRIGSTVDTALTCHTNSTTCCRGTSDTNAGPGLGEWFFPNETEIVRRRNASDNMFYWVRGYQAVRLFHQGDFSDSLGSYCCIIPDNSGVDEKICVNFTGKKLEFIML